MIEKLDAIGTDIQSKAFDLFLTRGEELGLDLDDWIRAEREPFPATEVRGDGKRRAVDIGAAVPGFKVGDQHVQVLPELSLVEGSIQTNPAANTADRKVLFSEFEEKKLFRPFSVLAVEATLNGRILKIVARKESG